MGLGDSHLLGATPLDPNEIDGLLPSHITTQEQLNQWEQTNIARAHQWLLSRRVRNVFSEQFVRELHRHMFDETWRWAGSFRKTERNLGVAPEQIAPRLRDLLADARYWLEHKTYSIDEAAVRFHHRLVSIHSFANGNGRHSRLMTDVLLARVDAQPFTWGRSDLIGAGRARDDYLIALRAADGRDYAALLQFVRS